LSKLFKKDLEAIIKSALLILNNESIAILRGRYRMVVGFTTIYAINAYYH
jgi:hypothetical protein